MEVRSLLARRLVGAVLLAIAAAACGAEPVITPSAGPALPFDPRWTGDGCRGVGADVVIHGSPIDANVSWVTSFNGFRTEIIWPLGYSARFVPNLEILDQTGKVVAREGDHLGGWCKTADTPEGVPIWVEASDVVSQR